jgi:4'-phosphopantetheinyl transferase
MARDRRSTENDAYKQNRDPSSSLDLSSDDVHVWCAPLEQPLQGMAKFFSLLSPDEVARSERFYFERDRSHFIVGRGLLRMLLGRYLQMEPGRVEFSYGQYGKPALKSVSQGKTLQFNLSHSKDLAVFIFSWNRLVGIDVEFVRPMPNQDRFAEQLFSAQESALIGSLFGQEKLDAFFTIWTCKEALFKASGAGLTTSLTEAEISLTDRGAARLLSIGGDQEQAAEWHMETFKPAAEYQASFAVAGHDLQITTHTLDNSPLRTI